MRRSITTGLGVISAFAFLVSACGGSGGSTTSGVTETAKTIRIVVRDGKVVGGLNKTTVDKNTNVKLLVSADVSDEVHVHGYDLMANVAPGKPAKIVFVANIPGRFEIELENRGLQISDFKVSA